MSDTYPSATLYQIYTRAYLSQLTSVLGRPATLDDIPDDSLKKLAEQGFNWIYLLGIWTTGEEGRRIALANEPLCRELQAVFPDIRDDEIDSSVFAIADYHVPVRHGGEAALARLRQRMAGYGLRLMLDFVPNHLATDHPWVWENPDYILNGTPELMLQYPEIYFRKLTAKGERILAHGRDPYFPPWNDTVQLNYSNPDLVEAMSQELLRIAGLCDGVRCDMAMLVLPEVFQRTWGISGMPFWTEAIQGVRAAHPGFTFLAEVYWHMEVTLQERGFDFTYDKSFYDHLIWQQTDQLRAHLRIDPAVQARMAHFLENHDEKRAATVFPLPMHRAAAVITFMTPGLRFFQHGQFQGYPVRIPMQMTRAIPIKPDKEIEALYDRILACLKLPALQHGSWQLLEPPPNNEKRAECQPVIAFSWCSPDKSFVWVVVNYSEQATRCTLSLPFDELPGRTWKLTDCMSGVKMECKGDELLYQGLILDLPAWSAHIFEVQS